MTTPDFTRPVEVGMKKESDWLEQEFVPMVLDDKLWPAQIARWLDDERVGREVFMYGATVHSPNVSYGTRLANLYHDTAERVIAGAHKGFLVDTIPIDESIGSWQSAVRFWELFTRRLEGALLEYSSITRACHDPLRVEYGLISLAGQFDVSPSTLYHVFAKKCHNPLVEPMLLSAMTSKQQEGFTEIWDMLVSTDKFPSLTEKLWADANCDTQNTSPRKQVSHLKGLARRIGFYGVFRYCKYVYKNNRRGRTKLIRSICELFEKHAQCEEDFRSLWSIHIDCFPNEFMGTWDPETRTSVYAYGEGSFQDYLRMRIYLRAKSRRWPIPWQKTILSSCGFTIMSA